MSDEITQRHLRKLRIRGAPTAIPGSAGFVGSYDAEETWRQTGRALVLPLERTFDAALLKATFERLASVAQAKNLTVPEATLFALKGDPTQDPPHKWEYEAVLPIQGATKADPESDVAISRIQGGMHIFALTARGLPDLANLYVYLFGKFMPSKKQELLRPYLLHRVLENLEGHDDSKLVIGVYVPAGLSIRPVSGSGEGVEA